MRGVSICLSNTQLQRSCLLKCQTIPFTQTQIYSLESVVKSISLATQDIICQDTCCSYLIIFPCIGMLCSSRCAPQLHFPLPAAHTQHTHHPPPCFTIHHHRLFFIQVFGVIATHHPHPHLTVFYLSLFFVPRSPSPPPLLTVPIISLNRRSRFR